jgi:hypothetical protein
MANRPCLRLSGVFPQVQKIKRFRRWPEHNL